MMDVVNRARPPAVALETTLILHGVPRGEGAGLAGDLARIVREHGANPALVGVYGGRPTVGLSEEELGVMLSAARVPKANTSNLGALMHRGEHAATTVSTTMELAARAGVLVFATGGLGGVHRGYGARLDISADLAAFTRFPVAVVTSGVKGLLDVVSTREALEALGVPVVGYRTERFPAFYLRDGGAGVDASFETVEELAGYVSKEMRRTGRGIVVCNPIPESDAIDTSSWSGWLAQAEREVARVRGGAGADGRDGRDGRDVTPMLLGRLHEVSGGATLRANLSLVRSNAGVAGALAVAMAGVDEAR